MAVPSKPCLECVCKWHRPECDCVSDDFKRHTLLMREHCRVEKQNKTTAVWVVIFIVLGLGLGFLAMH